MSPLTSCGQCGTEVFVEHVDRWTDIPKAPGFVAIAWQCPSCMFEGKIAVTAAVWNALCYEGTVGERVIENLTSEFGKDLAMIGDAADLLAVWRSYRTPPPIEVLPGRGCGCKTCVARRKIYETEY